MKNSFVFRSVLTEKIYKDDSLKSYKEGILKYSDTLVIALDRHLTKRGALSGKPIPSSALTEQLKTLKTSLMELRTYKAFCFDFKDIGKEIQGREIPHNVLNFHEKYPNLDLNSLCDLVSELCDSLDINFHKITKSGEYYVEALEGADLGRDFEIGVWGKREELRDAGWNLLYVLISRELEREGCSESLV